MILRMMALVAALAGSAATGGLSVSAVLAAPASVIPAATRPQDDRLTNAFFAIDTATKDANHTTYESQVELLKDLGYAGWAPSGGENVPEMLKAVDAQGIKMTALYVGVNVDPDQPSYDPKLRDGIAALKGRDTFLWLFVTSKKYAASSTEADGRAVAAVREVADMAGRAGIRVALYPHFGFYMARMRDAVRLAKKIDRKNVGVTFNLCHWLRTDRGRDRDLEGTLKLAKPYLFVVTINGADREAEGWDRLIQPLGRGDYDVCALLRRLHEMGFRGPIGFQGYGIKGDVRQILSETMTTWRQYVDRCR